MRVKSTQLKFDKEDRRKINNESTYEDDIENESPQNIHDIKEQKHSTQT